MLDDELTTSKSFYCRFRLADRVFGVPVSLVKEAHAPTAITPIPGAPSAVRGYVNLRGNLYLVLDPRELLTGESGTVAKDGHFIVFNAAAGETFAIHTDGVEDIVAIRREQIDGPKADPRRPSDENDHLRRLVTGHAKLDDELMTLVEPRELLPAVFHGRQLAEGV